MAVDSKASLWVVYSVVCLLAHLHMLVQCHVALRCESCGAATS